MTLEKQIGIVITPRGLKFPKNPMMRHSKGFGYTEITVPQYQRFMGLYPEVKEWLDGFESKRTKEIYGNVFLHFCIKVDITPKEFGDLWRSHDGMVKAREIATSYVRTLKSGNQAKMTVSALKSFFRVYSRGFQLALDTRKGGACYISLKKQRESRKIRHAWGSLDDIRKKAYEIIVQARDLHDKASLTFLYRTGVRDNVLKSLKMKDIQDYIEVDDMRLLVLTVTGDLDSKISNYDFPLLDDAQKYGYYTYLAGDALELLETYVKENRRNAKDEDYVFFPCRKEKRRNALATLQGRFKTCCKRAGFNPKEFWLHQLRSLFEQLGNNALKVTEIEFLAGHILKGAQKKYKWQNKIDAARLYLKIDFGLPIPEKDQLLAEKDKELETLRKQMRKYEEAIQKAKATTKIEIEPLRPQATREELTDAFRLFQENLETTSQPTKSEPVTYSQEAKSSEVSMKTQQKTEYPFIPMYPDEIEAARKMREESTQVGQPKVGKCLRGIRSFQWDIQCKVCRDRHPSDYAKCTAPQKPKISTQLPLKRW